MADEYVRKQDVSNWLKQYGQDVLHGKYKFSLMYIWKNIMDLPSADVVPVRHGRWIDADFCGQYECSECGNNAVDLYDYCPFCGAKMGAQGEE